MIEKSRNASATIKGFAFQFDATILKILGLEKDSFLTIEGIEDIDIFYFDIESYHQCKYYESKSLTPSIVREPLLYMLQDFKARTQYRKDNVTYNLYCHFSDSKQDSNQISLNFLNKILIEKKKNKSTNNFEIINHKLKLDLSDDELDQFLKNFKITITSQYEQHKQEVIFFLSKEFNCSIMESQQYYYPTAFSLIFKYATKKTVNERTIKKDEFVNSLNKTHILFNIWYLKEKNTQQYCSHLRKSHFSYTNRPNFLFFFIFELLPKYDFIDLIQVITLIIDKWGGKISQNKPESERKTPVIYLKDIRLNDLQRIKNQLIDDDIHINDGYPHKQSDFQIKKFMECPKNINKKHIRIIDNCDIFQKCIEEISLTKIIYEFYRINPLEKIGCGKHIQIYIENLEMIKLIV
ncbi:DUF4297 family anti-phage-associated protein [uncultured Methanospirillum sp.]|uniref:DUF4297 family anti-phage-associated protein n=1 Tax=uncultured Methanospirillum sp. TaxID=262503 RepID=UPI0029C74832|nr:DUF4297 family anti-phage-associated protein [uncultured Methanospirillum sp.]